MYNKTTQLAEALEGVRDGMSIMVGGFGVPGTPFTLIEELVRQGRRNLTIIKNDANERGMGVDHLLASGQVSRLITTHIGLNRRAVEAMNAGTLSVEFNSQGILAERIRAGGVGLRAIVTDIGRGTLLASGKQTVTIDGEELLVEPALRADIALIHAAEADRFGNLRYAAAARNFSPLMAMAADHVIAEVETVVEIGAISPNDVHTPGPFVNAVVQLEHISEAYDVVRRA